MPKIANETGPTYEPGLPPPEGPQNPADALRSRGKLGPYSDIDPATQPPGALPAQRIELNEDGSPAEPVDAPAAQAETAGAERGAGREAPGAGQPLEGQQVAPGEEGEVVGDGTGEALPDADQPGPPAQSATKAEWVDYVTTYHQLSDDEANDLTKAELIERYGTQ